jgi:anti-sigma regulatory factor (Ser/Thr protein kinase)
VGQRAGTLAVTPVSGHSVVAILGRGRLPRDVVAELVAVLADEPPVVVCDLDGLAAAGPAVADMFTPVTDYLRLWPGTVVVVIARDPRLRRWVLTAAQDRLLVHGSLTAGIAAAEAVMPHVQRRGLRLAPLPSQVPAARAFVTQTLRSWGLTDAVGAATLVVSELVTNSVLHAFTVLDVAVSATEGRVRVAVHDHADGAPRAPEEPRLETHAGGRGLHLVRAVTRGWGVLSAKYGGKTVWAVLEQAPTTDRARAVPEAASRQSPTVPAVRQRVGPRRWEDG